MTNNSKLAIALTLVLGLGGCVDFNRMNDQFNNLELEGNASPAYVFPLINSSITFRELAQKTGANTIIFTKTIGDTTLYYMAFRDTIDVQNPALDFVIPNASFNSSLALNSAEIPAITPPSGVVVGPFNKAISIGYSPIANSGIRRVDLSKGVLNGVITSTFQNSIQAQITINSIKRKVDNLPLTLPVNLNSGGTSVSQAINLNEYYIDLYDPSTSSYNTFSIAVNFSIISNGHPITSSDKLTLDIAISGLDFSVVYGKIYTSLYIGKQNLSVDIFRNTIDASIHLEKPSISFEFTSTYGVPLRFTFPSIVARRGAIKDSLRNTTIIPNTLLIGSPNLLPYPTSASPLVPVNKVFVLNYLNSNLSNIIDIAPTDIQLDTYLQLGSTSDPSADYFISKNSRVGMRTNIEIPLHGYANFVLNRDTIPNVKLPDIDFKKFGVDSAQIAIKLTVANGMPIDIGLQAYFVDSTNTTLDSLFKEAGYNLFMKSATINPTTGEVVGINSVEHSIVIPKSMYDRIRKTDRIVLKASVFTTKPSSGPRPSIVIQSTNSIGIKMNVIVQAFI